MPSKNSVTLLNKFTNRDIGHHIPKKLYSLYQFGVRAFTIQPVTSCNGNARISHLGSRAAAEQQMYRLLRHKKLFLLVWRAVSKQLPLKDSDVVNVDYSNLGPLAILGFAKQTRRGRAIPVLMRSLASNTQGQKKTHPKYQKLKDYYSSWKKTVEADQFSFVTKSLTLLRYLYATQPRLVFDRGFANKTIVQFLISSNWVFYTRIRDNYWVECSGLHTRVRDLAQGDYTVVWGGITLRLIITKPRKRYVQPWYILTNDTVTSMSKITKLYYHRFEIEESFRDLKSLFLLKWSRIRTWQSLRVLLCFMSLAVIVAMALFKPNQQAEAEQTIHPKKSLSIVRMWQEQLNKERLRLTTSKLQFHAGF
jgi:hypothetical protein